MFDVFLLKALRVLDRTWFPIKTTVLNIDTWTLGISIYIYIYMMIIYIYLYILCICLEMSPGTPGRLLYKRLELTISFADRHAGCG